MNLLSEFYKETADNIVKVIVEKAAEYKQISVNRFSVARKARFQAVLDSEIRPTKKLVIARRQRYKSFDGGRSVLNRA